PAHQPSPVIEAEVVDAHAPEPPRESSAPAQQPTQHLITLPATIGDRGGAATVNVAVAVSVQVAAQVSTQAAAPAATPRKRGRLKPVQDEWGFFDPDQCGFKALLARLDAVTDEGGD